MLDLWSFTDGPVYTQVGIDSPIMEGFCSSAALTVLQDYPTLLTLERNIPIVKVPVTVSMSIGL